MRLSAKTDYALRAAAELAAAGEERRTAAELAAAQHIPARFLETVLRELRRGGVVRSQRGVDGGHSLARPASEITIADILRAVGGPLTEVRGIRPESFAATGPAQAMRTVLVALRASERRILEGVTLADVIADELPPELAELTQDPDAWEPH